MFPLTAKESYSKQLDSRPEIDGVFSTDIIISYTIKYILEKGKIPDDYIIVGYDGVDISNYVYPFTLLYLMFEETCCA